MASPASLALSSAIGAIGTVTGALLAGAEGAFRLEANAPLRRGPNKLLSVAAEDADDALGVCDVGKTLAFVAVVRKTFIEVRAEIAETEAAGVRSEPIMRRLSGRVAARLPCEDRLDMSGTDSSHSRRCVMGDGTPRTQRYECVGRKRSRPLKHKCQYMVGLLSEPEFNVMKKLLGPGAIRMKCIAKQSGGAKVMIHGEGSRRQDTSSEEEDAASGPLRICVLSHTAPKVDRAAKLVEALLSEVHMEYIAFCRDRDLPIPELLITRLEVDDLSPDTSRADRAVGSDQDICLH